MLETLAPQVLRPRRLADGKPPGCTGEEDDMKRLCLVLLASVLLVVLLPATALAYTPLLVSPADKSQVTRTAPNGWYLDLAWSGSNSLTTYAFEIATSPNVDSQGNFLQNNVVCANYGIFKTYYNNSSYLNPGTYLTPGTYYWHVEDMFPMDSFNFSPWSSTWSFTVPAPSSNEYWMNLQPKALAWEMTQGDLPSAAKSVVFGCNGPQQTTYYLAFVVPTDAWVKVYQANSNTYSFVADPTGLAPGTYQSKFTVYEALDSAFAHQVLGSPYDYPLALVVRAKAGSTYYDPKRPACTLSRPKVTGTASARRGTRLSGKVTPAHKTPVKIQVQHLARGKWKAYKKLATSTSAKGSWSLKARLARGTYRVRSLTVSYPAYKAGTSSWRRVVVK
jgi:hypothetical protein